MGRTLLNSFHEVTITLTAKLDKDSMKTGNYRLISLMNLDAKILNRVLANNGAPGWLRQKSIELLISGS